MNSIDDGGALVLARRGDLPDALQPGDRALDQFRDAAFDDLVRCALIDRVDRDDRRIDGRILAHGEAREGHEPADDQQQADHDREHRPADEDV
jgi:hypothetical protein